MSYDAGRVVRVDKREDEVQTTYTTCTRATPSPLAGQKSRTWHDTTSIITKLPGPTTVGDTTRTADKLSFEFYFALYETICFS